ncbi:MAG: cellulase family glycosylhydrolase [Chloroflexota bacterium]
MTARILSPFLLVLIIGIGAVQFGPSHTRLNNPPPLATCDTATIEAALDELPAYTPTSDQPFVTLSNDGFSVDGQPLRLRGVNYYPAAYPWRRFLTETDPATLDRELSMLAEAGFNSLRIFLWNEALFQCEGDGAVPEPAAFARLDSVFDAAAQHGFYVMPTLNDLPDLEAYPLYDNPPHIIAQTAFIVERYRDEPTIIAWDLRNEGDIDYDGFNAFDQGAFPQSDVIDWLAETSTAVRALDDNHLITAGWRFNEQHTAPYVDFISFHHWRGADTLRSRLARMGHDKPVLLQEFGFTTWDLSEDVHATAIRDVVRLVEYERPDVLGWMVWTAFDFPLTATCYPGDCISADNREHHFGLYYPDGTPKPAAKILIEELETLAG